MFSIVVFYRGGLAHYLISREDQLYIADLRRYDGKPANEPPIRICIDHNGLSHEPGVPQQLVSNLVQMINKRNAGFGRISHMDKSDSTSAVVAS